MKIIPLKQNKNLCWWCNSPANSKEHKFKKTDFVRIYGKGPYKDSETRPNLISPSGFKFIQGPGSNHIKFDNSLCSECNTTKSQPFDQAYDFFMEFFVKNVGIILEKETVDLREVYGTNWVQEKKNLLRYFVKHICCRVASFSFQIDPQIIKFMNGDITLNNINIDFRIKLGMWVLENEYKKTSMPYTNLFLGKLRYYGYLESNEVHRLSSWMSYSCMSICYVYDRNISHQKYPGIKDFLEGPYILFKKVDLKNCPPFKPDLGTKKLIEILENSDKALDDEDGIRYSEELMDLGLYLKYLNLKLT